MLNTPPSLEMEGWKDVTGISDLLNTLFFQRSRYQDEETDVILGVVLALHKTVPSPSWHQYSAYVQPVSLGDYLPVINRVRAAVAGSKTNREFRAVLVSGRLRSFDQPNIVDAFHRYFGHSVGLTENGALYEASCTHEEMTQISHEYETAKYELSMCQQGVDEDTYDDWLRAREGQLRWFAAQLIDYLKTPGMYISSQSRVRIERAIRDLNRAYINP
ncbi:hypothetical protein KGQ71_05340 [Patescibacteria group bacterium]|nr:hypothetical protein [Patescibacteria group bacterium]